MRRGDIDESKDTPAGAKDVAFRVTLEKGIAKLAPTGIGPELSATPDY